MSYEASQSSLIPATRNALAPRGGLAFDGTAGTRVSSTLTGQSLGTDPFSVSLVVRVPTTNPTNYPSLFQLNSTLGGLASPNSLRAEIDTAGTLTFVLDAASDAHNNTATVPGFVAAWAGKIINLVFVRAATGNPSLYINGVSQTLTFGTNGTPPTWQGSVSNGYFQVGSSTNGREIKEAIYSASLYNCALTQADVTEIYELGGAVPERFKFGSQVSTTNTAVVATNGDFTSFPGASTDGFTASAASGAHYAAISSSTIRASAGRQLRISGALTLNNAKVVIPNFRVLNDSNAYTPTAGSFSGVLTVGVVVNSATFMLVQASGDSDFTLAGVKIQPLGAVVHFDADLDGIGYQLHDQSTNKLDAVLTTTGVSWTKPARRGYVRGTLTWAGTHEPKSLLGNVRDLPNEAVVTLVTTKATAATSGSGVSVGSVNTIARYVAANAITTAKKAHALANATPSSTVDGDCTLALDPDTANYTGSITAEVHYAVTEGTP